MTNSVQVRGFKARSTEVTTVLARADWFLVCSVSNKCSVWLRLECLALAAAACSCGRKLRKFSTSWSWVSQYLKERIIGEGQIYRVPALGLTVTLPFVASGWC